MIYQESSLTAFFDNFYKEIMQAKRMAMEARPNNCDIICDQIFTKLSAFIQNNMSVYIQDLGDFIESNLNEVMYLMVALADEILLNFNWLGQEKWSENLLEQKFFGTHKAGDEVFNRIDGFLTNRNPLLTEIAAIYLKTLALGFKGKYRTSNQMVVITYRKKLYKFVTQNDLDNDFSKIFLQGYNFTLSSIPAQYFPNHNMWDYIFYAFLFLFLLGTSIFWEIEINPLKVLLKNIDMAIN